MAQTKKTKTKKQAVQVVVADVVGVAERLSAEEEKQLRRCETVIRRGWDTFVNVGKALASIQKDRLYREEFKTFEAYCRDRWQYGKSHAHRLIGAAEVVDNLSPIGDKLPRPMNEAQVRPLIGLDPEDQVQAWKSAVEEASGKGVTARLVRRAAEPYLVAKPKRSRKPFSGKSAGAIARLQAVQAALSALSENNLDQVRRRLEELQALLMSDSRGSLQ